MNFRVIFIEQCERLLVGSEQAVPPNQVSCCFSKRGFVLLAEMHDVEQVARAVGLCCKIFSFVQAALLWKA